DVYSALVGGPPETQEDRPREGTRTQTGNVGENQLQVVVSPIRLDIILSPAPLGAQNMLGSFEIAMGDFRPELTKFEKMMLAWLPSWEVPTTRVALIGRAICLTDSAEDAYKVLQANLKSVRVRPGKMSDLIFRVNWKAKTKTIPERHFNRLSTWSAAR